MALAVKHGKCQHINFLILENLTIIKYRFTLITLNRMMWAAGFLASLGSITYPAISAFVSIHSNADTQGTYTKNSTYFTKHSILSVCNNEIY